MAKKSGCLFIFSPSFFYDVLAPCVLIGLLHCDTIQWSSLIDEVTAGE